MERFEINRENKIMMRELTCRPPVASTFWDKPQNGAQGEIYNIYQHLYWDMYIYITYKYIQAYTIIY